MGAEHIKKYYLYQPSWEDNNASDKRILQSFDSKPIIRSINGKGKEQNNPQIEYDLHGKHT